MIKVSITLEGSREELSSVLEHIAEMREEEEIETASREANTAGASEVILSWTESLVAIVWRDLSLDCRELLLEIARHEDAVSTYDLGEIMGLTPQEIGGRLSSLGRRINQHGLNSLPDPLDWRGGDIMIPIWRDTISKIG